MLGNLTHIIAKPIKIATITIAIVIGIVNCDNIDCILYAFLDAAL